MRCLALMATFIGALLLTSMAQAQMTKFVSQEGRFSVLMPGTPEKSTQQKTSSTGEVLQLYQFAVRLTFTDVYSVSYNDYPPLGEVTPQRLLQMTVDNARRSMTVISDRSFTFQGLPARRFKVTNGNLVLDILLVMKGTRYYQVMRGAPPGKF